MRNIRHNTFINVNCVLKVQNTYAEMNKCKNTRKSNIMADNFLHEHNINSLAVAVATATVAVSRVLLHLTLHPPPSLEPLCWQITELPCW